MLKISLLWIAVLCASTHAITVRDLYESSGPGSVTVPSADDESARIQLNSPVHFCTDTFDEVFINTNGILTFMNEFPEFLNIQFPIEYPSISPFYSNVDVTLGDASTRITYYQTSSDSGLLSRASSTIRGAFTDSARFQATSILIATWSNVPKWRGSQNRRERSYEKNTYQVAIISNADETYVEYLYPQGGIQWIQAETGESGLPDIRARAGFILTDGRIVELRGSGTDKVRHLSETSNYGKPGRWLYRVGKLDQDSSLKEPDTVPARHEEANPTSCATGGRFQCHSAANCEDNAHGQGGFCCKCKDGYYGNGYSCLKTRVPVRVTGIVHGHISDNQVHSQVQSYIVTSDGKAYTALSSIGSADLGTKLQILEIIGGVIGWVFAKPIGRLYNGYQITGGKFNHTSNIRFDTGENVHITQRFTGLNAWDQLAVEIEISGDVPAVHEGVKLTMEDFFEEYTASGSSITSVTNHRVQLSSGDPDITYTIYQNINFEPCEFSDQNQLVQFINGRMKTSKINLSYHTNEGAVRITTLTKVGITDKHNPCMEATCGENTVCIATSDDLYECECLNGFTNGNDDTCVDIDECRGSHICHEHAECINRIGGYDCHCMPGYEGNGFECEESSDRSDHLHARPPRPPYFVPTRCGDCNENAHCQNDVCVCNSGFQGNGHDCQMICALDEYFNGANCIKLATDQEDEIQPYCNSQGDCNCPHGYKLIEYAHTSVCRIDDEATDDIQQQQSCDIVNNCHRFADCQFDQSTYRYECVCGPGYDGDGYNCLETETNCAQEDICDIQADCIYNSTLRTSVCVCRTGYEGSGKSCQALTECRADSDCGYHSFCNQGICECVSGYQRETNSDLCVPAGSCNGAYCAENAYCRFDNHRRINYCHCPDGYEGDGINQCKFVPPPCNVRNNCGLYATCLPNYLTSKYECTCNDGYIGDGLVCVPDMNCNNNPSLCDVNADCLPTSNGYKCICMQGFTGNGSVCREPPKLEVGFLIISQGVATVKIPLSGSKRGVPVSTASMAIGVDKDCAEGKVYWSDISAKSIFSSKYDGTEKETFINSDTVSPEGVAIDWVSRRLYWTDSGKDTIEVASLDNSTLRSVLINKGLVNPRGIALDPHSKKIYWSDWNRDDPKIESANLDGSDRKVIASQPQVKLPNSLAISLNSGEICFADAGVGNQKIECIDTYTQQSRVIADKLSYPFGLAITNEQFYWSDWTTKKIESISVDGVRNAGIQAPLFSSHKMYGMTAVTDQCPIYFSVCNVNNGDCPPNRICLINPQSPSGKTCKCVNHADCNINDVDPYLE